MMKGGKEGVVEWRGEGDMVESDGGDREEWWRVMNGGWGREEGGGVGNDGGGGCWAVVVHGR